MKRCAIELVDAIKKLTAEEEVRPRRQIEALQKLSDIFTLNLGEDKAGDEITTTTSGTPTTRAVIRETPRVHRRLTRNNTPGILPTFEGGKQKESLATFEGEKQRKKAKVQYEPTQTNYYDGLEETTKDDEEMEQKPKEATWSNTHRVIRICKKLGRDAKNNEKKKRNKQKATIRDQQRHKQLAAKQRLEQSKLTIKQEFDKRANEREKDQTRQTANKRRRSPRLNPTTQHVAQQAYRELPQFRSPQMFPPIASVAFNMAAMRIHENPLHTPQPTTCWTCFFFSSSAFCVLSSGIGSCAALPIFLVGRGMESIVVRLVFRVCILITTV